MKTIEEFDSRFRGTQFAGNWVQDLEEILWNARLQNEEFFAEGVRFCEEFLVRFGEQGSRITENMRRALGTFHSALDRQAAADSLFSRWLPSEYCLESATPSSLTHDTYVPPSGTGIYYLVRGRNVCGLGGYGAASDGTPDTSTACP